MPQTSFAILTSTGRAKEAAALANATTVEITHIAIGDGATVPSGGETALYHQVALKTISGSGTVVGAANVAYFDAYLTAGEGPYTIREAGLFDSDGDLIAIAHYDPPINKPIPSSGQTVEGNIRIEVAFSDIENVTVVVDPTVLVALQRLLTLPWIPLISMTTTAPPGAPALGDTYLIPSGATGSWAGSAGKITEYTTAGWAMVTPRNGHGVGMPDGSIWRRINGVYVKLDVPLIVEASPTLYVRSDGNDANDGGANTSDRAFATIAAAISYGKRRFYLRPGQSLTIQIGLAGTYAAPPDVSDGGYITIRGDDSSPASYIISGAGTTNGGVISAGAGTRILLLGVTTHITSDDASPIATYGGGQVLLDAVYFTQAGAVTKSVLYANGGTIMISGNIRISGGGTYASLFEANGSGSGISINGICTLVGTPTFTNATAVATTNASITGRPGAGFVGSATGPRYAAILNGVINTLGSGASFFPGDSAGATATGGQYA